MDRQKRNSIITLVVLALLGTVYHFVWGSSGSEEPAVIPDKDLMSRLEIPYRLEDNESTNI